MKRNELRPWAKRELEHVRRVLKTQALTGSQRTELEDRAAALLDRRAAPWLPSDWGRRLIRTAPWFPTDTGSRLMVPVAAVTVIASVHHYCDGLLNVLVTLLILTIAFGCILSPRLNAESRHALQAMLDYTS